MTENELLFDDFVQSPEHFRKHGLSFILRPLPFPLNRLQEKLQLSIQTKHGIREMIFDFVENAHFNAFAAKYKDKYIIGISEAVYIILYDLFHRMMSHPFIMTDVGDPSKEDFSNHVTDYYTDLDSLVIKGHRGTMRLAMPNDKTRRDYAQHLTYLAISFLYHHEAAHIGNGHLDYIESLNKGCTLSEVNRLNYDIVDQFDFDLQTLEWDADCIGLGNTAYAHLHNLKYKTTKVDPIFQPFYPGPISALSDLYFAVINIIKLFGKGDYSNVKMGTSSHPDPSIRLLQIGEIMLAQAAGKGLNEVEKFVLAMLNRKKFIECQKAYMLITGKETTFVHSSKPHPFQFAIEENWKKNLRNKLIPFVAHTNLPI